MQDYHNLKVWQKSHQLTLDVYKATKLFPKEETYGLTSQLRRSCLSIPSNIAEGCGRNGDAEFLRFLQISAASASEADYQLFLSKELGYITESSYQQLSVAMTEVRQMLSTLLSKIRKGSADRQQMGIAGAKS